MALWLSRPIKKANKESTDQSKPTYHPHGDMRVCWASHHLIVFVTGVEAPHFILVGIQCLHALVGLYGPQLYQTIWATVEHDTEIKNYVNTPRDWHVGSHKRVHQQKWRYIWIQSTQAVHWGPFTHSSIGTMLHLALVRYAYAKGFWLVKIEQNLFILGSREIMFSLIYVTCVLESPWEVFWDQLRLSWDSVELGWFVQERSAIVVFKAAKTNEPGWETLTRNQVSILLTNFKQVKSV